MLSLSHFSSFFHSIQITALFYGSVQHMETRVKLNYLSFGIPPSLRFTAPNSSRHIFIALLICLSTLMTLSALMNHKPSASHICL